MGTPIAYENSWAQGSNRSCSCRPMPQPQQHQIEVISVTYITACGNARFLTHWARPGIDLTSSLMLYQILNLLSHNGNSMQSCLKLQSNQSFPPHKLIRASFLTSFYFRLNSFDIFYFKMISEANSYLLNILSLCPALDYCHCSESAWIPQALHKQLHFYTFIFFFLHFRRLMLHLFSLVNCRLNRVVMLISVKDIPHQAVGKEHNCLLYHVKIKFNLYLLTSCSFLEQNYLKIDNCLFNKNQSKLVNYACLTDCGPPQSTWNVFSLINYYWEWWSFSNCSKGKQTNKLVNMHLAQKFGLIELNF